MARGCIRFIQWNVFNLDPRPWFCFIVILMDLMDVAVVGPFLPQMQQDFFGGLSRASLYSGIFAAGASFFAMIAIPIVGAWSDQYGRQPFMVIGVFIAALRMWSLTFGLSLWVYYGLAVPAGFSVFGLSNAYVADITPTKERARWFGTMISFLYASMMIGSLPGLFLSAHWSFRIGGIMAFLNLLYAVMVFPESLGFRKHAPSRADPSLIATADGSGDYVRHIDEQRAYTSSPMTPVVSSEFRDSSSYGAVDRVPSPIASPRAADSASPKPVPPPAPPNVQEDTENEEKTTDTDAPEAEKPSKSIKMPLLQRQESFRKPVVSPFTSLKYAFKTPFLRILSLLTFVSAIGEMGVMETTRLYLSNILHFSAQDLSLLTITLGISALILMLLVFPWLLKKLGEKKLIIFSLLVNGGRMICYCFANQKWQIYVIQGFTGFVFMGFPALATLLSRNTLVSEQGTAQGAISGVRQLTSGAGPLLFSLLFSYFVSGNAFVYFPQAPFVVASVIIFVAAGIATLLPDDNVDVNKSVLPPTVAIAGTLPPNFSLSGGSRSAVDGLEPPLMGRFTSDTSISSSSITSSPSFGPLSSGIRFPRGKGEVVDREAQLAEVDYEDGVANLLQNVERGF